jgi:hypothetical protein
VIDAVADTGYYLARSGVNDEDVLLVDRIPDSTRPMPVMDDFVIALCSDKAIKFGPHKGSVDRTCIRSIIVDKFLITYHFQELNAKLVPQLDLFFKNKIGGWRQACK